jgi:hypothetical protein
MNKGKQIYLAKQNYVVAYFINSWCGSDLLIRWLSLLLARQRLSSVKNLHECEDHKWFKVRDVNVFCFVSLKSEIRVPQVENHWSTPIEIEIDF